MPRSFSTAAASPAASCSLRRLSWRPGSASSMDWPPNRTASLCWLCTPRSSAGHPGCGCWRSSSATPGPIPTPGLPAATKLSRRCDRASKLGGMRAVSTQDDDLTWMPGWRLRDLMVRAERSRAAAAVFIGKTNLPEFALFPRTINLLTPECVNPWDLQRTSGGSSGGAAASMAAGLTPLAIGSDGGGSIRIPAALCGVFGLHPSNGRVPRHGGFGGTLIFSGAGPITRDVRDAAMLLQVLAGADSRDPTSMKEPPPDYLASLESGVAGLRALWVPACGRIEGLDRRVVAAVAD